MEFDMKRIRTIGCRAAGMGMLLAALAGAAGCTGTTQGTAGSAPAETSITVLDPGKWDSDTYTEVMELIEANAFTEDAYAVFDWDNTCIFQDTTDNLMNYQIWNLAFKMTPEEFEYAVTHGNNAPIPTDDLVDPYRDVDGNPVNIEALAADLVSDYTYFWDHYQGLNPDADGALADIEAVRATDQFKDFQAKCWFTYIGLVDTFGENVAYTWQANFLTGNTADELSELVHDGVEWALAEKIEDVYYESPATLPGEAGQVSNAQIDNNFRKGLRIVPEMASLMNTLRENGIDVYVSTAAVEYVVEAFAGNPDYGYNVPEDNVIGIRMQFDDEGRIKSEIVDPSEHAINVKQGKVDNIVRYLVPEYDRNPILIGGDSSGDYEMMTQFSGLNDTEMVNDKEPLQLVLISNCVKTGNIGELSALAASQMVEDDPQLVLQGRNENTGLWIPDEQTLRLGETERTLVHE